MQYSFSDTTVQTLTLQPTVQNGIIMYEDSPLVSQIISISLWLDPAVVHSEMVDQLCQLCSICFLFQVKAVKNGHILVVDEADKAPTYVTCILKTLVESGEMHLSDGRRIVSGECSQDENSEDGSAKQSDLCESHCHRHHQHCCHYCHGGWDTPPLPIGSPTVRGYVI